jgi:uncharacterized protein YjbJ (UPF0337 family)
LLESVSPLMGGKGNYQKSLIFLKENKMSTQSSEKVIEGQWDKIKGKIKQQWGKITDDDINKINGSYDELVGVIKKLYGHSQKEIEEQLNKLINGFDLNNIKQVAKNSVDAVKEKTENVLRYVEENPMKSVLIAMAVGALATIFLSKGKN